MTANASIVGAMSIAAGMKNVGILKLIPQCAPKVGSQSRIRRYDDGIWG